MSRQIWLLRAAEQSDSHDFGMRLLPAAIAKSFRYSKVQLPLILPSYKAESTWREMRIDIFHLCSAGFEKLAQTSECPGTSIAAFQNRLSADAVRRSNSLASRTNPSSTPVWKSPCWTEEFVVGAALSAESTRSFGHLHAALAQLRRMRRPVRLVIFGPRQNQQLLNASQGKELGLGMQWVQDDADAHNLVEGCDVFVSLQKGVPRLVLQAMSSGVPVITTAIRIPEVLQHQRTAIVLRPDDWQGLQEALLGLAGNPEMRVTLGGNARKSMEARYSESYLSRKYFPLLTKKGKSLVRGLAKWVLFALVPTPHLIRCGNHDRPEIALSIDDGPDPNFTPQILDILRHYNLKATFFVVGGCAEQYPDLVLRMDREGHEIGNHSYSHPYFNRVSWRAAADEIEMARSVLDSLLRKKCKLFRPPSGKLSLRSIIPAWRNGLHVALWSVDLRDYCAQVGEVEVKLAQTKLSAGDVVLYHGTSDAALGALPRVIEAALRQGLRPVTISELMRPRR